MECKEVKVLAGGDPRNHEYQVCYRRKHLRRAHDPTTFNTHSL